MRYRKKLVFFLLGLGVLASLSACKKKEEDVAQEQELTAVGLNDLEEGCFYVKSGDQFWKLPFEECNFDTTEDPISTDKKQVGFVSTNLDEERIVDFVYEDNAIPTLYKNDTLVYVTNDTISSFTWERYLDCGYSIGVYGLEVNGSDKVSTGEYSNNSTISDFTQQLVANGFESIDGMVFDKINNTPITESYLNKTAGVITGMSKDATANVDVFVGTTHTAITSKADTRYFQAFELYNSTQYSLSTDGYAMLEIPSYLKSGYYLLNNGAFVKFVNIDRGNDEASIDLTVPYYYEGDNGKLMTYYEWREANGYVDDGVTKDTAPTGEDDGIDVTEYPERMKLTIDSAAVGLNVKVDYSYKNENASQTASQTGEFPRAVLMDPYGNITSLADAENKTDNGDYEMSASLDTAPSGDWYLLFRNFDNAYKNVSAEVLSGNANTYIHNGSTGNISIYYEGTATPQTLKVTWEQTDRTATDVKLRLPDNSTVYSITDNPEMFNSYAGGVDILLPEMTSGTYKLELKGDALGRVWVTRENTPASTETEAPAESTAETAAEG